MKIKSILTFTFIFVCAGTCLLIMAQDARSPLLDSWEQYLKLKKNSEFNLKWISIGPVMNSARVEAVQCDPSAPGTMYVAFGSGNLWKTTNHGLTWQPIFENQSALGIGDIALAPSNPDIIWLGSGESLKKPRNFTMPGTGVFRSDDGGKTWRNMGLPDSFHIGEIAVHPEDPDVVFVAVMGHFWTTNTNRPLWAATPTFQAAKFRTGSAGRPRRPLCGRQNNSRETAKRLRWCGRSRHRCMRQNPPVRGE